MSANQKETRKMMSHETIYKIMQWLPIVVSAAFFVKNLVAGNTTAMITIGLCLAVFGILLIVMKMQNVRLYVREYVLAVALPILVCMISLNSGASYSDDFSLYLAVIALTGMFLEPAFTRAQFILVDICLVIMYLVHPEKAESLGQYILCAVVFTLAAVLFYLVIKRGRAFIEVSEERAKESEQLLESIRSMGDHLQQDFEDSSARIEVSTQGLQEGSESIAKGAGEVLDSCNVVRDKIKETGDQIGHLNADVREFEAVLTDNRKNMEAMSEQVEAVSDIISQSGAVFRTMEDQMHEIAGIAKQISDISFKLTLLSLNAAVESARAGEAGAGFEVLASEMRDLSENSTRFAGQVAEVLTDLLGKVAETSERVSGSEEALGRSKETMEVLSLSFERLDQQFNALYENIERQNSNVNQIDYIFDTLNQRVADMHSSSFTNQNAVEAIVDAMEVYKGNVSKIVENTRTV
ncbi:MAG: hypothetical protein E7292_12475 [Lachnospiraceae bacterium]|nr:hypothetical protein [Lachnospiraceae bacterium]